MNHFEYRDGVLHAENVDLDRLARDVGTPFYCYSSATLVAPLSGVRKCLCRYGRNGLFRHEGKFQPGCAPNTCREGAGMDVVSEGELRRAIAQQVFPVRASPFSGVGKTCGGNHLRTRSSRFSVSMSSPSRNWKRSRGLLRSQRRDSSRVLARQPRCGRTHARQDLHGKIGKQVRHSPVHARDVYREAASLPGIRVSGVDMHIGSQITQLAPFDDGVFAARAVRHDNCVTTATISSRRSRWRPWNPISRGRGHRRLPSGTLCSDRQEATPTRWAANSCSNPGRLLVGNAGILVTRIAYVKQRRRARPS
jgi:diaminopimelate decarboxylase